jgi:hypothetical protein
MDLVVYLVIGAVLLAFLRRFVYRRVLDGQMPVWLGAVIAGAVWASLPVLLVLIAGAELIPIVWVLSAGSFIAAAASVPLFFTLTSGRRGDRDHAD